MSRTSLIPALISTAALLAASQARAQRAHASLAAIDTAAAIPRDPAVITGTLANGLHYYIRANHKPAHRAELRLVVNAGSVLEDSAQRGVAHFDEHMAFDGTTHFPHSALISYLESTGVRFGADLNAATGFDQTVYRLTVPSDSAGLLDRGIRIMDDWAHDLSFDSAAMARERGVVIEEWRSGRGAAARMRDAQFPILFAGSRYARRLPIANEHILRTFAPAQAVRFYRTWYRPDLMAVVAVGDFDAQRVQQEIVQDFSRIPKPVHPVERPDYPVPTIDSTRVAIATDPEATQSTVSLYYLQHVQRDSTVGDFRRDLVESLYTGMLDQRLRDVARQANPPFVGAYTGQGRLVRTKDVYVLAAATRDRQLLRGFQALLTEAQRARQHGFTPTELARAKSDLMRQMTERYAERHTTNSASFVSDYVNNFLEGDAIPSIAEEDTLYHALMPGITVAEVDSLAVRWLANRDRVILVNAPRKDTANIPAAAVFRAVMDSIDHASLVAYQDTVSTEPLVPHPPVPGRIVAETHDARIGTTTWTLSNGVHVVLDPTTFSSDELLVDGFSPGGLSLASASNLVPARTAAGVVGAGGVGAFSATALDKALAGKDVSVRPSFGSDETDIGGGGSPKDAPTLFQLIYLYFTAPRRDSMAVAAFRDRLDAALANRSASPGAAFGDTVHATLSAHDPRERPLTRAMLSQMSTDRSFAFYRARFADASNFTFVFVGNIDTVAIRPLVEQYLGGLPSRGVRDRVRPVMRDYPRGVITRDVRKGEEPKSQTAVVFTGSLPRLSRHAVYALTSLVDVLDIRLRQRLRQAMSGTYGVGVSAAPQRYPHPRYAVAVEFGSAPGRADQLTRAAFAEIDSIRVHGPTAGDVEKVKETELRERQVNLRRNAFWLGVLHSYLRNGWNPDGILTYTNEVHRLTAGAVRDAARRYLDPHRYVCVSLYPAAANGATTTGAATTGTRAPSPSSSVPTPKRTRP